MSDIDGQQDSRLKQGLPTHPAMLTANISVADMTTTGRHPGIDNAPPLAYGKNLVLTAEKVEQAFAVFSRVLGKTVLPRISYGYRGKALNDAVGSKDTSAHCLGLAADLIIPAELGIKRAFEALRDDPVYMVDVDQLIDERGCVHVGLAIPAHDFVPRHELRGDATVNGKRTYPLLGIWKPGGR